VNAIIKDAFPVEFSQLVFWFIQFSLEFAFPTSALAFELFSLEHCLQIQRLTMPSIAWNQFSINNLPIAYLLPSIAWNQFSINNLPIAYLLILHVESCYLIKNMSTSHLTNHHKTWVMLANWENTILFNKRRN